MHTLEDCIRDIGEIPLCKCGCKNKVNIQSYRYNEYKRNGYSKFISGHQFRGLILNNRPFFGHKHTEKWKEQTSKRMSGLGNSMYGKLGNLCPMYGITGENHPHFGKPKPESQKKKMSISIKEYYKIHPEKIKKGKNSSRYGKAPSIKSGYGKGSHYQSPLQGQVYLRSSWELKYAQYLDSIGEPWFYEAGRFPMIINERDTTYRPDFCLPLKMEFIEVKGYWKEGDISKLKSDKFKEELNDEELMGIFGYKILFGEDLKKLGIDLKKKK